MSSLTHAQGGPRPAFLDNAIFHPGLQVHAIAEPRTDTRLSLLISCFCYTTVAGLIALTVQHREAIKSTISKLPVITLVETVDAVIAPPTPALPAAPAAGPALSAFPDSLRVANPIDALVPDEPPVSLPTLYQGDSVVSLNTGKTGTGGAHLGSGDSSGHPNALGTSGSTVTEISLSQVQILHQINPVYPIMAKIGKVQGDVVVRITIDSAGLPSDVKVLSGPEQLRAEALRCARLWRFTPARSGGVAVPAAFHLTLRFVLKG